MKDPATADPKTTIFPTFECFSDAIEFIEHIARECSEKLDDITLVHGICLSENDREFAHAWIEDSKTKIVIFCGIYMDRKVYLAAPMEDYFETFKVKESTRYTVQEAMKENLRTAHFGPWEEKYQILCGNEDEHIFLGGGFMRNVGFIGSLPNATKETEKEKQ